MLMTVAGPEWEEIGHIRDPRMARVGSEYTAAAGGIVLVMLGGSVYTCSECH